MIFKYHNFALLIGRAFLLRNIVMHKYICEYCVTFLRCKEDI